ncbi:hypothetical protein Efla_007194 [Eimeria flavescens]
MHALCSTADELACSVVTRNMNCKRSTACRSLVCNVGCERIVPLSLLLIVQAGISLLLTAQTLSLHCGEPSESRRCECAPRPSDFAQTSAQKAVPRGQEHLSHKRFAECTTSQHVALQIQTVGRL